MLQNISLGLCLNEPKVHNWCYIVILTMNQSTNLYCNQHNSAFASTKTNNKYKKAEHRRHKNSYNQLQKLKLKKVL